MYSKGLVINNSVKKIFDFLKAKSKKIRSTVLTQAIKQFDLEYLKYNERNNF